MTKKHNTSIHGFVSIEAAASAIGKMRYDALAEFLLCLEIEMTVQQKKDKFYGKVKLAADTEPLIKALGESHEVAALLFKKYKKFMQEELAADND